MKQTKATRWYKTHKIGQAHLAPGMSLSSYQSIMADYRGMSLQNMPDHDLDEIIQRIATIVNKYKSRSVQQSIMEAAKIEQ